MKLLRSPPWSPELCPEPVFSPGEAGACSSCCSGAGPGFECRPRPEPHDSGIALQTRALKARLQETPASARKVSGSMHP